MAHINAEIERLLSRVAACGHGDSPWMRRLIGQLRFAWHFASVFPEQTNEWRALVRDCAARMIEALPSTAPADLETLVLQAETILAPVGQIAKQYTVHCCGHAHIDMNWTWPLYETVATAHDTFTTVDRLMERYPGVTFAQSQISIYDMMERYCPELWLRIRERIREGRWHVTAGSWVEGDKNMASGESLARHMLYSKRWLKDHMELPIDAVAIDWMPDTFGHPWTIPSILRQGGIRWYYRCRPEHGPWICWWEGPDGQRILVFRDKGWYNAEVESEIITNHFCDYVTENGLKDMLWIYGVGDHGGGITMRHLEMIETLNSWPIFPCLVHSSPERYFTIVEREGANLPVHCGDWNTVFEGCYSSQSRIKRINRRSETLLPEAEWLAWLGSSLLGMEYPQKQLEDAWRHLLFNQFHDILAGSSGHGALEEAEIRFQQIEAIAGAVKMRVLRQLCARIDTTCGGRFVQAQAWAQSLGRGAGDVRLPGTVSSWSSGQPDVEALVVWNTLPFTRSEVVETRIWNRNWAAERIVVTDDKGCSVPAQVTGTGNDVGHLAMNIAFPVVDVPAMGYRTYYVHTHDDPLQTDGGACYENEQTIMNSRWRVTIDPATGGIAHLIDRRTGEDWVPEGQILGRLSLHHETPHLMTAWCRQAGCPGTPLTDGVVIDETDPRDARSGDSLGMVTSMRHAQRGPIRVAYRTLHRIGRSRVRLEVALTEGSDLVELNVSMEWREMGSPDTGVPVLTMALPFTVDQPVFRTEIPFGVQERPTDGSEIPALRWVDVSNDRCGVTVVNDSRYGYRVESGVLHATVLRCSYDPDPAPEVGEHLVRFGVAPHQGACRPDQATRLAQCWAQPLAPVGADVHSGELTGSGSFLAIEGGTVALSSVKRAEDRDALILRLWETSGALTEAVIAMPGLPDGAYIYRTVDLLERPIGDAERVPADKVIHLTVDAHAIVSLAVERIQ